ncbi:hypothetical protein BJ508DRAFT_221704 [Ascobolus immersus RN42]|uniref:Dynamin-type G domain-containing protein n=1 Tax=Ascobolus immersus RN42 TaxID=1160509 RepID=A0A3N4IHN8_ASCIM|nr:hypothetical protein BJ508DRAFT_221704 [Ascobolus immersus RN42]
MSSSEFLPRGLVRQTAPVVETASDSGYGGSEGVPEAMGEILAGNGGNETNRAQWASNVQQLYYNQNRVALGRSINRTVETLKEFQQMNAKWPAHYPSVRQSEPEHTIHRSNTSNVIDLTREAPRPGTIRRAATTVDDIEAPTTPAAEPRLVTPQIAQDFNVLKLDLKLGALHQNALVHSLEKGSVASLLDGKISQSIKHLHALRERIDDTASKVLVTGDLNAGKSTFCNALLRKKVLPEDQQPCTSIFCEVLDARENNDVEEVHALHKDTPYKKNDESTYDVYTLDQLEDLVIDQEKYAQVKIYIEDVRTIDQSLLRNGVVDIALIDAPGLNLDSIKTTAVFARQEEIDVVVFVVSAENHFTLSAKEFIWNAANEKAYIFIVVNRFDNIRDKERCKRMILDQVASLSPRTRQDASELVHFVSSNAVLDGQDQAKMADFDKLEASLRTFVLEKRARSKLAPAKTYLLNLLEDLHSLGDVNREVTEQELERIRHELENLRPQYEAAIKTRSQVSDDLDKSVEETCGTVYKDTRKTLGMTISKMDEKPVVAYDGLINALSYAEATRAALLAKIQGAVIACEEAARKRTISGVGAINALGLLHLNGDYVEKTFRPELMFNRKRDALARTVQTDIDIFDFFDFDHQEKIAGFGMSFSVAAAVGGHFLGIGSWIDALWKTTSFLGPRTTKKLLVPVILAAAGAGLFIVASDIPNAVPRKMAKKIRKQLEDIDYIHGNAERIAREVRKVLTYPADELKNSFARNVEKKGRETEDLKKSLAESEVARKWFSNLVREVEGISKGVHGVDLEGGPVKA